MVYKLLDAAVVSGPGTGVAVNPMTKKTFPLIITGIIDDSVQLEASMDNTNWAPVDGGEFLEDTATGLNIKFPYVRANLTRSTGTVTVEIDI